MVAGIIPPPILAKTALDETVVFLREAEANDFDNGQWSIQQDIEHALAQQLTQRATECLRTACAARDLTMIVVDPHTQDRHAIPSEYFDQRSLAELEFSSAFFRACELSAIVAADPLFKLVRPFRGWVHGFIEPQFRAWLQDPNLGPQAGPRLRPFFHLDLAEPRRTHLHETEPGLQTEGTPSDAAPPTVPLRRKRGRRPKQFERVKKGMAADIKAGINPKDMLEKEWEARYCASRDVCRRAYAVLMSEFESSNSDK